MAVYLPSGKCYVCIQTERDVPEPVHPSESSVDIDVGVARFVMPSGAVLTFLHSFRKHAKKLASS